MFVNPFGEVPKILQGNEGIAAKSFLTVQANLHYKLGYEKYFGRENWLDLEGRVPAELVAKSFLAYISRLIFESKFVLLGLHHQQVIHKGSKCLYVHRNTSVIMPVALFFNGRFCRSHKELLPLVQLIPCCISVDSVADCCVSNSLCFHSLSNWVNRLHGIAGHSMTTSHDLFLTLPYSRLSLRIVYWFRGFLRGGW